METPQPPSRAAATLELEVWDRELVQPAGWRDLRDMRRGGGRLEKAQDDAAGRGESDAPAANFGRFLSEEHHHLYGRPWCIGRTYFDFLVAQGLAPTDRVLDFGCGAGRLGIWLIDYLEVGGYVGVDHHWLAIDAFARYEIPLHGLAGKRPRLVLDGSLDVGRLGQAFDVVLDCFVSFHLDGADRLALYRGFAEALVPGGRIFLPHAATLDADSLAALGLALVDEQVVVSTFLVGHFPEAKARDHWHVIQKR